MNKTELIAAIAKEARLSKSDTEKFFSSMVTVIVKGLKKGERIAIPGFISFAKVKRAARTGRNPKTGSPIKIAAKNAIKIKAGRNLTNVVN